MKKKIIIQSESADTSTDDVISWLNYYHQLERVVAFFDDYPISQLDFDYTLKAPKITINGISFSTSDSYWYRRGEFRFDGYLKSAYKEVNRYLFHNYLPSISSILYAPLCKRQLNCYNDNFIEKLRMLNEARKVGLTCPPSLYTDSLEKVKQFLQEHDTIITKAAIAPFGKVVLDKTTYRFSSGTIKLCIKDLQSMPSHFMPSLFQKYMEKKYEIRTFYLDGQFYSMAIFSQMNDKTQIDCRERTEQPLRKTPYKMPADYEEKLSALMSVCSLNCCSIDTIVTPNNELCFLEINPIGQFQWLSKSCNYQIEKRIAQYLKSEEE